VIQEWREIVTFKGYSVSDQGQIKSDKTGRILKLSQNQQGVVMVGMMRGGVQYHRSLAKLVAQAFIPRTYPAFDTPINVDGDRTNNRVDNLMWRPRWFAINYHRQFRHRYENPIPKMIVDMKTGEMYENSWECAISNGLLERDVVMGISNRTWVWPTYQEFRMYGFTY